MKRVSLVNILACLFLLGACQEKVNQTKEFQGAKNIILLIGDGMGTSQVYAGIVASKGTLRMEEFSDIGFSKTYSANDFNTDSGAGGTAIATGHKTYNNAIGVNEDSLVCRSILEYAEDHGKLTGLIATSGITHATPASFIAHQPSRYLYEEIAADFLKTDIDLFIGGGRNHFDKRKDSIDLTKTLQHMGYQMAFTLKELEAVHHTKLACLLYPGAPPRWSDGRKEMLGLSMAKALEVLPGDNGFFLMVEGSQIDWGGHDKDINYVTEELLDFDAAVGAALDFAKKDGNTLVIVTADHETGGLSLLDGDIQKGTIDAQFSTNHHTGVMVPVLAYGPGSGLFRGIYENTDLFYKMMEVYGFEVIETDDGP